MRRAFFVTPPSCLATLLWLAALWLASQSGCHKPSQNAEVTEAGAAATTTAQSDSGAGPVATADAAGSADADSQSDANGSAEAVEVGIQSAIAGARALDWLRVRKALEGQAPAAVTRTWQERLLLARARVETGATDATAATDLQALSQGEGVPMVAQKLARKWLPNAWMLAGAPKSVLPLLQESDSSKDLVLACNAAALAEDDDALQKFAAKFLAKKKRGRMDEAEVRAARLMRADKTKAQAGMREDAAWIALHAPDHASDALAIRRAELSYGQTLERIEKQQEYGKHEAALAQFEGLAKGFPEVTPTCRLEAEILYRSRSRYADASKLFSSCAQSSKSESERAELMFLAARSLARAHQDDQAIAEYEKLAAAMPKSSFASQARYQVARLHTMHARFREGAAAWQAYKAHSGKHEDPESKIPHAIADLLSGHPKEAETKFGALATAGVHPARTEYLAAKAAALAHVPGAEARFRDLAGKEEFSLVGAFARANLPAAAVQASNVTPLRAQAAAGPDPLPADVQILLAIGLESEAEEELANQHGGKRPKGENGTRAECEAYGRTGRSKRQFRLSNNLGPYETSIVQSDNAWAWNCSYPKPFPAVVEEAARAYPIDPNFVYAIMRTESAFDPEARSPVGAMGLLQLMPQTAADLWKRRGQPHPLSLPITPQMNISLGTQYLSELYTQFDGNLPLVAAAYNAGGEAVSRWKAALSGADLDIFVELIPFTETREYVHRVMGAYLHYSALSGKASSAMQVGLKL
jgi:soluble lytic murein transglycosylase